MRYSCYTINSHMVNDARGIIQEPLKWVQLAINSCISSPFASKLSTFFPYQTSLATDVGSRAVTLVPTCTSPKPYNKPTKHMNNKNKTTKKKILGTGKKSTSNPRNPN